MTNDPAQNNSVQQNKASLTYKDAGVDIDAGNTLVDRIKGAVKRTTRPEVMGGIGGFGALCELPTKYKQPVLVAGTDGVGTKLRLAMDTNRHSSVGIDLVAMCVNDLIVQGAEPLFFLDYYATGKLNVDTAADVVDGIAEGCELSGCALIGGETAEMPGMYEGDDYDLAGFCVGVVEKDGVIDGSNVKTGDVMIGLASSGPHSNGYSLIRKVIEVSNADLNSAFGDTTLADALLAPTRIYVKSTLALIEKTTVNAISHITGGGLLENLPRVMPKGTRAVIDATSWQRPAVFDWLQSEGNIENNEMMRTFNCGIGLVVVVPADEADNALQTLADLGETASVIGQIEAAEQADSEPEVTINYAKA